MSGVLSANSLPVLSGLWNLEIYNVDASDLICDSVAQIITVNFVDSTSPLCQTNLQPGDCEDLILSEMIEGTSNNKCIELYNPTDLPIDLTTGGYQITVYTNGSATGTVTALSGVVPAEGTFVICNASAGAAFTALADVVGGAMNGATFFNGDDAVAL